MSEDDKDWWRGNGQSRRLVARTVVEDGAERNDQAKYDLLLTGVAAWNAARAVAEGTQEKIPKSDRRVLYQLIADCEVRSREEFIKLQAMTSLDHQAARDAHFNIRVAAALLTMVHQYAQLGASAESAINDDTTE